MQWESTLAILAAQKKNIRYEVTYENIARTLSILLTWFHKESEFPRLNGQESRELEHHIRSLICQNPDAISQAMRFTDYMVETFGEPTIKQ